MKRTFFLFLLFIVFSCLLWGCGDEEPMPTPPAPIAIPTESTVPPTLPEEVPPLSTLILREKDEELRIDYTLMAVSPDAPFTDFSGNPAPGITINTAGADALMAFLTSPQAMELAAAYGMEEYGINLYDADFSSAVEGEIPLASDETKNIRLSASKALVDSGLLPSLVKIFEETYGYTVEIRADETFLILSGARHGDADLVITSTKTMEEQFVEEGFARLCGTFSHHRVPFVHSYYVLCGPAHDPAGAAVCGSVREAFAAIAEGKHPFISRGDGFTLHAKEVSLWPTELGITTEPSSAQPHAQWYLSAGMDSGPCVVMAAETGAYVLTEKLTYLVYRSRIDGI